MIRSQREYVWERGGKAVGEPSVRFILIVNTVSCRNRAIGIIMSSRVLRFTVEKNDSVIHEQLYVNWTEQQTQMRKTGYTWSHLSFQLCVSMRTCTDLCLSHKPLLVSAYHPSEPPGCFGS